MTWPHHQSYGLDATGRRTLDLLSSAPNVKLAAIFSPEHGLYGNVDEKVASGTEPITTLPVYSLYGSATRPTEEMLAGLDALVFDIQDAGVRFYTYITTMAYTMEAAAKKGIPFYVLDRPAVGCSLTELAYAHGSNIVSRGGDGRRRQRECWPGNCDAL